jgi:hypothetical protein
MATSLLALRSADAVAISDDGHQISAGDADTSSSTGISIGDLQTMFSNIWKNYGSPYYKA